VSKYFRLGEIEQAISFKQNKDRKAWMYKPLTEKQTKFLSDFMDEGELAQIDRGGAVFLIGKIISNNIEASAYTPFTMREDDIGFDDPGYEMFGGDF